MSSVALALFVAVGVSAALAKSHHHSEGVGFYPRDIASWCFIADARTTTTTSSQDGGHSGGGALAVNWTQLMHNLQPILTYTTEVESKDGTREWIVVNLTTATVNVDPLRPFVASFARHPNVSSSLSLDYACPPVKYNGYPGGCATPNNTQLWAVHRSEGASGPILRIDVIRSGAPFPPVATLAADAPPFGIVRFDFSSDPIQVHSRGRLVVSKRAKSSNSSVPAGRCVAANTQPKLSLHGLRFSAFGVFSPDGGKAQMPSNWHMDDKKGLLVIEPMPSNFWFNRTGFFFATSQNCNFQHSCGYECEVYNYDSRFLDFVGEFAVLGKNSIRNFTVLRKVQIFLGNAIDAAGVFPCLVYMDGDTGLYLGLDKFDPDPAQGPTTAFYWYHRFVNRPPVFVSSGNHSSDAVPFPTVCPGNLTEWLGD